MNNPVIIPLLTISLVLGAAAILFWFRRRAQPPPERNEAVLNALAIGDMHHPGVLIRPYSPTEGDRTEPLPLDSEGLGGLAALVQQMPALGLAGTNLVSQSYVMRFAPEVAHRLTTGSASLMPSLEGGVRAIAVNSQGQIIGQGSLIAHTGLTAAATAVAVWQVLAMVTAQHYLVGIDRRLASLEEKLDAIKQRLEDRDRAALSSHFKQMKAIHVALTNCRLSELDVTSFVLEVDRIDFESGHLMEIFRLAMDREHEHIQKMSMQGFFDPSHEVRSASRHVGEYTHAAQDWTIAALARAAAVQVRSALPVDPAVAQQRLQAIQDELAQWQTDRRAFLDLVDQRAQEASTTVRVKFWEDDQAYRKKLLAAAADARSKLDAGYTHVEHSLVAVTDLLDAQGSRAGQPLDILVELDEQGQITGVHRLLTVAEKADKRRQ